MCRSDYATTSPIQRDLKACSDDDSQHLENLNININLGRSPVADGHYQKSEATAGSGLEEPLIRHTALL